MEFPNFEDLPDHVRGCITLGAINIKDLYRHSGDSSQI